MKPTTTHMELYGVILVESTQDELGEKLYVSKMEEEGAKSPGDHENYHLKINRIWVCLPLL